MQTIAIRRILCPTDFSDFSERALRLAVRWARWYRATITVLHVRPLPARTAALGVPDRGRGPCGKPGARSTDVRGLTRLVRDEGVPADAFVCEGDATREILACAHRVGADLLVMGTHGRSGFERWVLGSVAEKVLRKSACPVLTVGPGLPREGGQAREPVLCAVDFSPSGRRALDYALSLTEVARARLDVLHVVEEMPTFPSRGHPAIDTGAYRRWLIDEACRALHDLVAEAAPRGVPPDEKVTFGKAHEEILRVARDGLAALVVLGVRGRGALDLALFGSTTNQVVRRAACPVLSVREG